MSADSSTPTAPQSASSMPIAADGAPGRDTLLHRYMPSLDGLRGIAILWVMAHHLPGQLGGDANFLASRGAVGVELFFAISGFLVTRSLYQCVQRAASARGVTLAVVRDFAVRRIARIWPPYFLALSAAFAGLMIDPTFRSNSAQVREVFWAYPAFLANYVIPTHEPSLSLIVMWSLCFEEQFYVILLLMYMAVRRRIDRLWWLIAAAGILSIAARLFAAATYPELFGKYVMQMQTHWRFDAIAWGCLVWVFHRQLAAAWEKVRRPGLLQAALLTAAALVSFPMPDGASARALQYLLMAPVFAALVSALAFAPSAWMAKAFAWSPLALVGVVSYEIYLSHVVVYRVYERAHPQPWSGWGALDYLLLMAMAIVAGWIFHRLFGKPSQRWVRDRLARRAPASSGSVLAPAAG